MNPPSAKAISNSVDGLTNLQALHQDSQRLTPLGYHLATLPVDPRIGKMILFGAIFRCLGPVLTIAAGMSFRSPFLSPMDKRDEADAAKR